MAIVEKSFPRGGTIFSEAKATEKKDNILFGAVQLKKSKPKRKDNATFSLESDEAERQIETVSAELLSYDTIQDGMNIMGMVKHTDRLHMDISLPGRMTARVSTTEISEAYTKAMRSYIQSEGESDAMFKGLDQLYKVGQLVYGRVQEIIQKNAQRTHINMSLKPADVHGELSHVHVKKGFIFNGAIEEVQEHGFIIESGIRGLRAFLPADKAVSSDHTVGELVFIKVEKITADKSVSTCICKEVKGESLKIKNQVDPKLDYILPSTIVQFNVSKILKNGLQGKIMNESFTAYVNEHQLTDALSLPEDYEVNSTLQARVLYIMPLTKIVYLTLNLRNATDDLKTETDDALKRGDIVEKARVHHLGTGGVILILNNKHKGLISYKTIKANYKGNYDQDELLAKYAKKTKHKVRVMDYHLMDALYICSDHEKIVNEKVFAMEDLQPGELVKATVSERVTKVGGYAVKVGNIKGIIEKLYLAPTTKALEPNASIRCRVIALNPERKTVYFTNRPEYLSKNCKVLNTLSAAKVSATYTGTIVKCMAGYYLVKFFNNIKGILYKERLNKMLVGGTEHFSEGQTMLFRIVSKNGEQIILSLAEETFRLGEICPAVVVNKLDAGLEIQINFHDDEETESSAIKGLIPIRLLSDFVDLLHAKLRMFPANAETKAACIEKNIFSLRDVEYFSQNLTKDWTSVETGDILKASVKNVTDEVIELMVPIQNYGKLVKIHTKMLVMSAYKNPNIVLAEDQVVYVKVLSKELSTKTIAVSAKLTDVWDGKLDGSVKHLESYLNEIETIRKAYKKLKHPIARYAIGDKISAEFKGISTDSKDWLYESDKKVAAVVKASIAGAAKPPYVGALQECIVLWIDYSNELLLISNKPVDIQHITSDEQLPANLEGKSGVQAKVMLKLENVFICSLKKGQNPLVVCPIRLHFNDFECSASASINEGYFCRLAFIAGSKPIAVLEDTLKLWRDIQQKRKAQTALEALIPKKSKVEKKPSEPLKRKVKTEQPQAQEKKAKISAEMPTSDIFYIDNKPSKVGDEFLPVKYNKPKTMPGIGDFWQTALTPQKGNDADNYTSSDEEDDESGETKANQKKKRPTAAEKIKHQREEEERLRAIEEKYADPTQLPESIDQFDRLVLSEPNNSKNWINYMVFHLQSTEIDKARAVARRAIKSISYRNTEELINIWVALLNLELRYGNSETFDETLKEALTLNDPLKVYLRTIEILKDLQKTQQLTAVIGIITKKFKDQQEVWKAAANAYFSVGMAERAQQMLHKALASLPEREHVNTIVIFANLNHKHGQNEMAQTLMDQVVTSYPKRVDVWTQYIDMLIKEKLVDSARTVLERAVAQKIPMKKMRTIFKKYLEFEERFGTEADVEKVKQLAKDYVKNNTNL